MPHNKNNREHYTNIQLIRRTLYSDVIEVHYKPHRTNKMIYVFLIRYQIHNGIRVFSHAITTSIPHFENAITEYRA